MLGRWITPDPFAGYIDNPQSLNRYSYVLNNSNSSAEECDATGGEEGAPDQSVTVSADAPPDDPCVLPGACGGGAGGNGGGSGGGGGSTLDDRANALANALNKTGIQSLGNPCTVGAFYLASGTAGALTNGGVLTEGTEAAASYWPQALSQVSNWLYRQAATRGPVANFILNIPKNYNKAKAKVLGACNAMQ